MTAGLLGHREICPHVRHQIRNAWRKKKTLSSFERFSSSVPEKMACVSSMFTWIIIQRTGHFRYGAARQEPRIMNEREGCSIQPEVDNLQMDFSFRMNLWNVHERWDILHNRIHMHYRYPAVLNTWRRPSPRKLIRYSMQSPASNENIFFKRQGTEFEIV